MIEIFIPTKNRLNKEKTYEILTNLGLSPRLVIEPQEVEQAKKLGFNFISLPDNNRGITYSRNYILDYCQKNNIEKAVMMDDDIIQFRRVIAGKGYKDNTCFLDALEYFKEVNMCGSMQYGQFAWAQKKHIKFNTYLEVIFFLYMPDIGNTRFEEDTIEDRDFTLQLLLNRRVDTFSLQHYGFQVPSIGTNKGGIASDSRAKKQEEWSYKMQKKWGPDIIKIVTKKNGYVDVRINWKNVYLKRSQYQLWNEIE